MEDITGNPWFQWEDTAYIGFRVNAINQGKTWTPEQLKKSNSNAGSGSEVTMQGSLHIDNLHGLGDAKDDVCRTSSYLWLHAY